MSSGRVTPVILEFIMAKKINSHTDLSITWVEKLNRFRLDARPIGASRETFKTKIEAVSKAKDLFIKWNDGAPIIVEERWSVDTAIEKYIEIGQLRVDDEQDTYGDNYYGQQIQQLGLLQKLTLGDFRLGSMKVDQIF